MTHLPELISDLALVLAVAALTSLLFRRIKQPVVLGYIIAGFLVGPHFSFFPTITEGKSISVWAEIGVIFLLFSLGLEFSFKKLARVGGTATVTAVFEVVFMTILGFLLGRLFAWSVIDSIFLGGILAISSTTIILRAFDELGVKGRGYVNLVFGILVVEDLVAILLLAILSTIAASQSFEGMKLALSIGKLMFFLILWFLGGIFILPTLLRRAKSIMSSENLLVISVALCFVMVVFATNAGFSPALGAFIMGSLLAETPEGKRIEHLVEPLKSLFASVFFVSVGMLIDPKILVDYAMPVAVITVVTILGKAMSTIIGALISGNSLKHSIQSGLSLAQIGEFSFIIASLGLSLKVTSEFLYPVAVSVSVVTTFVTPFLIKSSDSVFAFVDSRLPEKWKNSLNNYSTASRSVSERTEWGIVLKAYGIKIVVNCVVVLAIFLGARYFLQPFLESKLGDETTASTVSLLTSLLVSLPFIWALVFKKTTRAAAAVLWRERKFGGPLLMLEIVRWLSAVVMISALSVQFIEIEYSIALALFLVVIVVFGFSKRLEIIYSSIEQRFITNLSAKEQYEKRNDIPALAPWDAHLVWLKVSPDSSMIGKTLESLAIRERWGVTLALIERGSKRIPAPGRSEYLFPEDKIAVIGNDDQIFKFREQVEVDAKEDEHGLDSHYGLHRYFVRANSQYIGRTIRDSGIRQISHGLVVGVERKGRRILNPDSSLKIEPEDLLWIVGDSKRIRDL